MKKGFTLIELLGVILLLAVIGLITTPIVMRVIDSSEKKAAITDMQHLEKAANFFYLNEMSINQKFRETTFRCNGTACSNGINILELSGNVPSDGSIYIDGDGNIKLDSILINDYYCTETSDSYDCNKVNQTVVENDYILMKDRQSATLTNIYGNSKQGGLPNEYQQVEYIESNGTQYITLDYKASNNTSSEGKYQLTAITTTMLFGSRTSSTSNFYGLNWGGSTANPAYYNSYNSGVITNKTIDTNIHTFHKDKAILYIDNTKLSTHTNTASFTTPYNMVVFGCNTNGTVGLFTSARIFYLQFYDYDTLKIDLVPCYRKSDNVIGLYDLVNDKFYTNEGTGQFTKGADVLPTTENPIDIESVGDLVTDTRDPNYGKYKIPVEVVRGKNLYSQGNMSFTSSLHLILSNEIKAGTYTISALFNNDSDIYNNGLLFYGNEKNMYGNLSYTKGERTSKTVTFSADVSKLVLQMPELMLVSQTFK